MTALNKLNPHFKEHLFSLNIVNYILIALIVVLLSESLPIAIALVFVFLTRVILQKSALIITPFLLIVFITDFNPALRNLIIGFSFFLLSIELINKHGFKFSRYPNLPLPILISMISLLIAMIISTLNSNYILLGLNQILRVIVFFLFIYLFSANIISYDHIHDVINSLILTGLFLGGTVMMEFVNSGFSIFNFVGSVITRIGGFYSNVNAVSVPIFVSVILLFYKIKVAESKTKKNTYSLLFVFSLIFLMINNSRSAIIALIIALFVILYFRDRKIFVVALTATLFLLPVLYFFSPIGEVVEFYFRLERLTSGREVWWQMATDMFFHSPFLGVGPASFKYEMYKFLPVQLGSWEELGIRELFYLTDSGIQHNFLLFISSELGLLGLAAVIGISHSFIRSYFLSSKQHNLNTRQKTLNFTLLAIGFGFLGRALFESINIFSYGWLTGDLPFWLTFLLICKINELKNLEEIR